MRAIVYARVSSGAQRDRHTIASQLRDVPAYCAAQGWEVVGTFTDDGVSAKAGNLDARDGYRAMLAAIRPLRADVVCVVDVSRLTRAEDPVERAQVVASITSAGAQVAIVGAGIQDVRTFAGDAYLTLQAMFAAEENRRRRERTLAGQRTAVGRGRKPRGRTPYGLAYAHDSRDHAWSPHPEQAPIVAELFARVAAGESTARIARDLNDREVRRPDGGRWYPTKVQAIVHSEVYTGRLVVDVARGLSVPVPPLVAPEIAAAARDALLARYRRPPPRTRWHSLLAGVATCGLCGEPIGVCTSTARGADVRPIAYRCLSRRYYRRQGEDHCGLPTARVDLLDLVVWDQLVALIDATTVDQALATVPREAATVSLADARAELVRVDRAQDAALAQLARGLISQEVADAQVARLATRRQAAQEAIRAAERQAAGPRTAAAGDAIAAALDAIRRAAHKASREQRAAWFRALVATAVVRPGVVTLDVRMPIATAICATAPERSPARWSGAPVLGLIEVAIPAPERRRRAA